MITNLLTSCELTKPTAQVNPIELESPEIEFYLDNRQIDKSKVENLSKENLLVEIGDKNNSEDTIIRIRYFSSLEQELNYAKKREIPLEKIFDIEKHLAEYAESSGAIKIYEEKGEIPQKFLDYQSKYIAKNLPKVPLKPQSKLFGMIQITSLLTSTAPMIQLGFFGKDHYGGSTMVFAGHATPFFPWGWSKKISRYHINWGTFIVYGYFALYDKTFYRRKFYHSWNWTRRHVLFNSYYNLSWANDRAKSAFHP